MADAASHDKLVAEFISITGANETQARFHLESAAWNIETAIGSFFESPGDDAAMADASDAGDRGASTSSSAAQPSIGGSSSESNQPESSRPPKDSRIKTFRDLISGGGQDSHDHDEDEGQDYFAGGEKSGVMMKGGPKEKRPDAPDLVKEILNKAAKAGPAPDDFTPKKPSYFTGSGYRLGSEEEGNQAPAQPAVQGPSTSPDPSTQPAVRHLTFWRNGFSIEDGPLRGYDDPENQEFLKAIKSGRAPTSLLNVAFGQPVEVKVAHRMGEDYVPPPKKPVSSFSGSGNRLGGIVPGETNAMSIPGGFPGSSGRAAAEPAAPSSSSSSASVPSISVDSSQPVTSIQIRLADGTRLVARFNHTHTVSDLYSFVTSSRPGNSGRSFVLQTTFPVKEITDKSQMLKDAGLLNAVVVQKYV